MISVKSTLCRDVRLAAVFSVSDIGARCFLCTRWRSLTLFWNTLINALMTNNEWQKRQWQYPSLGSRSHWYVIKNINSKIWKKYVNKYMLNATLAKKCNKNTPKNEKRTKYIYSFNGKIIFAMSNFYPREVADFCNVQLYQREVTD